MDGDVAYLAETDVFYFGNAPGETGNSAVNALVSSVDALRILQNVSASAAIASRFDVNRDGRIGAGDRLVVLGNLSAIEPLALLNLTGTPATSLSPVRMVDRAASTHVPRSVSFFVSGHEVRVRWMSDGTSVTVATTDDLAGGFGNPWIPNRPSSLRASRSSASCPSTATIARDFTASKHRGGVDSGKPDAGGAILRETYSPRRVARSWSQAMSGLFGDGRS